MASSGLHGVVNQSQAVIKAPGSNKPIQGPPGPQGPIGPTGPGYTGPIGPTGPSQVRRVRKDLLAFRALQDQSVRKDRPGLRVLLDHKEYKGLQGPD
jgi:hypothetical protein